MTLRPGRNDTWMGRLREGFGGLGGDRGSAVGDAIHSVRITQRRNHLTRHEIHYRDGSLAIVDHLGRPYQREGGAPPRRSQGQPLHEPAPLHRFDENVVPPQLADGSYGLADPEPKNRTSYVPPLQYLRDAARNTAAYFHLGHARSTPQSENPFADNFIPPPPLPSYEQARRAPALPRAATEATHLPPPPPTYFDALLSSDSTYYSPLNLRPPEPPRPPPYTLFDPAPRPPES